MCPINHLQFSLIYAFIGIKAVKTWHFVPYLPCTVMNNLDKQPFMSLQKIVLDVSSISSTKQHGMVLKQTEKNKP